MAKREVHITVDLKSKSYQEITLKQLDTTELIFKVLDNNVAFDLTGLTAKIYFVKPNNSVVQQSAAIENGQVVADLIADCVRSYGRGKVEVELSENEEIVSSFQVSVVIEQSGKGNVNSDNDNCYFENLENLRNTLQKKLDDGDFIGPKGDKGDKGDKGNKGDTGPQGIPGNDYILTEEDKQEIVEEITEDAESAFNQNVSQKTTEAIDAITTAKTNALSELNTIVSNFNNSKIEERISQYFNMTPDYGVYTVRFAKFATSSSPLGEKLDDNIGKSITCATDTVKEVSNYGQAFDSYDVNAYVDSTGKIHITAIKGSPGFIDTGENDVFVLLRTYWEKVWEDDDYWYYSRTYMPKDGYTICSQALNPDGSWRNYFLIAKYMGAKIDGTWYSSKGLAPTRSAASYNNCVSQMHSKGTYYAGTLLADIKHIMTTIWLKWATLNSQSVMRGNTSNNNQYVVALAESNVKRVLLSTANAANIDVLSCISVGDKTTNSSTDRGNAYMHNIADDVRVLSKETVTIEGTDYIALNLDVDETFSITDATTTYVSTMHERSGYSDLIKGRNGSPVSLTNGKHGNVIDGIEWAVGGWEVVGNAFMDIVDGTTRDVYVCNDASQLTSTVATAKTTYQKPSSQMTVTANNTWKYITEMVLDLVNGAPIITKAGQSGSSDSTGFCDGVYFDTGTSGQREFLGFGLLYYGSRAGASCVGGYYGLGTASWDILARLSIGALYQRVN